MSVQLLTHNELIADFLAKVGKGDLAGYEVADIFSGRFDQPLQFALRRLQTLRVILVDCHCDGTMSLPNEPPDLAFAA